jgi:hypothetical protein
MMHHSDGEAWKVLDSFDADFASDARNVHFGLETMALIYSVQTLHHTLVGRHCCAVQPTTISLYEV